MGGGNQALQLNPPNADLHISTNGSDWLWAAFSFITFGLLVTIVLDFLVRAHNIVRLYVHLTNGYV